MSAESDYISLESTATGLCLMKNASANWLNTPLLFAKTF